MIRKNELQCCHRVLPRIELVDDGLESDDGEEPGREPEDPGQAEDDEDDQRLGPGGVEQRPLHGGRRHGPDLELTTFPKRPTRFHSTLFP